MSRAGRRHIGDWLWPAECRDCDLVTEDPDGYHSEDEDLMPSDLLCPATGHEHQWRSVDEALAARRQAGEPIDVERLADALRNRVLKLRDLANAHMAGRRTDDAWREEAAAILAALVPVPSAADDLRATLDEHDRLAALRGPQVRGGG